MHEVAHDTHRPAWIGEDDAHAGPEQRLQPVAPRADGQIARAQIDHFRGVVQRHRTGFRKAPGASTSSGTLLATRPSAMPMKNKPPGRRCASTRFDHRTLGVGIEVDQHVPQEDRVERAGRIDRLAQIELAESNLRAQAGVHLHQAGRLAFAAQAVALQPLGRRRGAAGPQGNTPSQAARSTRSLMSVPSTLQSAGTRPKR